MSEENAPGEPASNPSSGKKLSKSAKGAAGKVRPYDLFVQDRVTRARMPTLEVINDRFSRLLRAALFQHLRKGVDLSSGTIELIKHSQLLENLETPSYLVLVGLRPLRGTMLVVADAPLVAAIVESRFGGNGRFPVSKAGREFTPVEQKVMRKVTELILEQFTTAWQRVADLEAEITRREFNPQFASVATAGEVMITSSFKVRVDQGDGELKVSIPSSMLGPLRDQLMSGVVADAAEADGRWFEMLKLGIEQVAMPLRVELAEIEMTVRDLLELHSGDVFEIERPQSVIVEADGLPLFRGRWGRSGNKSAVRIDEALTSLEEVISSKLNERSDHDGG